MHIRRVILPSEFNEEKEKLSAQAGGEEVYIITGGMIDAMALGKPICINGIWIAISKNSEMRLVEGIEDRWTKEYGLDGTEQEKEG